MYLHNSLNGVKCTLTNAITTTETTGIALTSAGSPWELPPEPEQIVDDAGTTYYRNYTLTITDAANPTRWEIVEVTLRSGSDPNFTYTFIRTKESSTGGVQAWDAGDIITWTVTDRDLANSNDVILSTTVPVTVPYDDRVYISPGMDAWTSNSLNASFLLGHPAGIKIKKVIINITANTLAGGGTGTNRPNVDFSNNESSGTLAYIDLGTTGIVEYTLNSSRNWNNKVAFLIGTKLQTSGSITIDSISYILSTPIIFT